MVYAAAGDWFAVAAGDTAVQGFIFDGYSGDLFDHFPAAVPGFAKNVPPEKQEEIADRGGALEILLNRAIRDNCESLACMTDYIELATQADFQEIFTDCLMF